MKPLSICPNLTVAELLSSQPKTISVFMRYRLYCVGCLMSSFDTLGQVVSNYHLPEQLFLAELRQAIQAEPE